MFEMDKSESPFEMAANLYLMLKRDHPGLRELQIVTMEAMVTGRIRSMECNTRHWHGVTGIQYGMNERVLYVPEQISRGESMDHLTKFASVILTWGERVIPMYTSQVTPGKPGAMTMLMEHYLGDEPPKRTLFMRVLSDGIGLYPRVGDLSTAITHYPVFGGGIYATHENRNENWKRHSGKAPCAYSLTPVQLFRRDEAQETAWCPRCRAIVGMVEYKYLLNGDVVKAAMNRTQAFHHERPEN